MSANTPASTEPAPEPQPYTLTPEVEQAIVQMMGMANLTLLTLLPPKSHDADEGIKRDQEKIQELGWGIIRNQSTPTRTPKA